MQKDAIVARAKQIVAESVPDNEDDEFPVALTLPNGKRTMHTFSKRNPFSSTYTMLQSSSKQALGFATIKLTYTLDGAPKIFEHSLNCYSRSKTKPMHNSISCSCQIRCSRSVTSRLASAKDWNHVVPFECTSSRSREVVCM